MLLEYTWFHTHQNKSETAPTDGQLIPTWNVPFLATENSLYNTISESWRLKMDIIDLDLGRWYYVGTNLTFRPSFGVRADWIRQRVSVSEFRKALGNVVADTVSIFQKSSSWAIGTKVGLDTNWNIGSGFRIYGSGEADLLFTKYTRLRSSESHTATPADTFLLKQSRVYAVRPHLDLELGMGWGMYLDCNNWYMDFSAGYGFQVFFDQNMFRHFSDDLTIGTSQLPNGNLYLQGLTIKYRLDF
jgi:hypothetical protein